MIRRDGPSAAQCPRRWILISQIEHAHLAARLAEPWESSAFPPLEPRDELLWAIEHHDDGWRHWEERPQVDPMTGVPRSFMEMPAGDAIAIWTGSIDAAAAAGPLEAYVVAGHFVALAKRAATWRKAAPSRDATAEFIRSHEEQMHGWLANWQAVDRAGNTARRVQTALEYLQFFDALSLWFCCAEATAAQELPTPGGGQLRLVPSDPEHISLTPWPMRSPSIEVEIVGRSVSAEHYPDSEELAASPSQPVSLRWALQPAGPGSAADPTNR